MAVAHLRRGIRSRAEIRALDAALERGVRDRDVAWLVEVVYAEDAVVLRPDRETVRGKAAVTELFRGLFRVGLRDLALDAFRLESSGDLACEIGRYRMRFAPDAAALVEEIGTYLAVYRREQRGTWRIAADVFSADGPAS